MRVAIVLVLVALGVGFLISDNMEVLVDDEVISQVQPEEEDLYQSYNRDYTDQSDMAWVQSQASNRASHRPSREDFGLDQDLQVDHSRSNTNMSTFASVHGLMSFDTDVDLIEVEEDFFVSHMADIYLNAPSYLGKDIAYEGFYLVYHDEAEGIDRKFVMREGPGCCPGDDIIGLEVFTDEDYRMGQWMRVQGELTEYRTHEGRLNLALDLDLVDPSVSEGARRVFR